MITAFPFRMPRLMPIVAALIASLPLVAGEPQPGQPSAPPVSGAATAPADGPIATFEPIDFPGPKALNEAGKERLRVERKAFAAEIRKSATKIDFEPAKLEAALVAFEQGALDTSADNRERCGQLLAVINPTFAEGWALYKSGRLAEAGTGPFEKLIFEKVKLVKAAYKHNTMPPYQYTLVRFLQGECQAKAGDLMKALVSYHVVWTMMPRSLTVGAPAALRPADIYEKSRRVHFAIWLYQAIIAHNGDHLGDQETLNLLNKVGQLMPTDPYRLAMRQAREAHARLLRGEVGEVTRGTQASLIAEIERMAPQPENEPRPFLEHTNTIAEGADKGGSLQEGKNPEEFLTQGTGDYNGGDDWGKLRAREKQQLLQLFQETYPQRYQEMLSDYFRSISAAESAAAGAQK